MRQGPVPAIVLDPARVARLKARAKLAGQVAGVVAAVAVLGALWVALHAAEDDWLEATLAAEP